MKRAALDFVKGRLEQKANSLFEFYEKREFLQKEKKIEELFGSRPYLLRKNAENKSL